MTSAKEKDPVIVVVQLSGGNDYLNTVVPYNNDLYYDNRPTVGIAQDNSLTWGTDEKDEFSTMRISEMLQLIASLRDFQYA